MRRSNPASIVFIEQLLDSIPVGFLWPITQWLLGYSDEYDSITCCEDIVTKLCGVSVVTVETFNVSEEDKWVDGLCHNIIHCWEWLSSSDRAGDELDSRLMSSPFSGTTPCPLRWARCFFSPCISKLWFTWRHLYDIQTSAM